VLAAGAIVLVLLFLTAPIASLPKAVLGAVIITAAIGLIEPAVWRELAKTDHVELTIAAVTTAGVIITGVLEAIIFAVGLSLIDVVRRSARPHDAVLGWVDSLGRWADVARHRDAEITPGVVVYRLDDRLFFANASYVKGRVQEALRGSPTTPTALVLDAEGMTHIDSAGMQALEDLTGTLDDDGIALHVARAKHPMADRLHECTPGARFHGTVRAAVHAAMRRPERGARRSFLSACPCAGVRVTPDALAAHPPLEGAQSLLRDAHLVGRSPHSGGCEAAENRDRHECREAGDGSDVRLGEAERRVAQRDRAEGRVAAGHVRAQSADPPRRFICTVGGAQQHDGGEHVRLLARRAERAVQRLVAQMVEHADREPGVGEEQLRFAEPGVGLHA
jgi:anti-anti-sigma regulatory factor